MDESDNSFSSVKFIPSGLRIMNLKNQLKFYLEHEGITVSQLARKSGVAKQKISEWMLGRSGNVAEIKKVADALDVSLDNLCFGSGAESIEGKGTDLDSLIGEGWIGGLFEVKLRRIKRGGNGDAK